MSSSSRKISPLSERRRHQLVHSVHHPEEGRLATSRGPDQRGDPPRGHHQVDSLEHEPLAEPRTRITRLDSRRARRRTAHERHPPGRAGHHGHLGHRTSVVRRRGLHDRVRRGHVGHVLSPRTTRSGIGRRRRADRTASGLLRAIAPDEPRDDEQDDHDDHQHERTGEAALDRRGIRLADVPVDEQRQALLRAVQGVVVVEVVTERGEEQRRGLPDSAQRCRE